ncbi:hypothetical protein [Dyadobacter frigoris]|uniref:Uncharacterized protein n=1 Tax=Dyadobacter frigoris TaxID=2576211 RepID=A0A4U6CPD4_9BACT|nr:hypothetical protein [Dyadobacter frigoris]TKT85251.1 hypothetical protein FDK13_34225 [Dyadobacter frigoris]
MLEKEYKPWFKKTAMEHINDNMEADRKRRMEEDRKRVPKEYSDRQLREMNRDTVYFGFGILAFSIILNLWTDWFGLPMFISLFGSLVLLIAGIRDFWLNDVPGLETKPLTRIFFWFSLAFIILIQYNLMFN